jgi:AcrR family transcriptional regulator
MLMEASVKRRYHAPRRAAQATETRRRVLAAAQSRFLADGYTATAVADIARDAGVSEATIFAIFGTKRGVLMAAIGAAVGGDAAEVSLAERPAWRAILAERDSVRMLERFAVLTVSTLARVAPLIAVLGAAAGSEPELAAMLEAGSQSRWGDCRMIAEVLHARGALRAGLEADRAADILWAHASAEMYGLLVDARGWNAKQYEEWSLAVLTATVLSPSVSGDERDTRRTP